jgi:hypothetical protein
VSDVSDVSDDLGVGAFEEHRGRLFGIAYRMLGSVADAEDVVQDAWVKWSQAARARDIANAGAYLARTVTNLCLSRSAPPPRSASGTSGRGCPSRWSASPTWRRR